MIEVTYFNWFGYDLTKPASLKKLINKLERIIRLSPEYKQWASFCKRGITKCPECNISREIDPLEVHHDELTLFEIVEKTIKKYSDNDQILDKTPIDIVKEILQLHLNNQVSYKVLCKSCHERLHAERKLKDKMKIY